MSFYVILNLIKSGNLPNLQIIQFPIAHQLVVVGTNCWSLEQKRPSVTFNDECVA